MKIDTSKIAGYDKMTAEEKIAALEAIEMQPDYTGYVKQEMYDKASSEAANFKKQLREAMTESERKVAEEAEAKAALEARVASLEKEKALSDQTAQFIGIGYSTEDAEKAAKALVSGNYAELVVIQKKFLNDQKAAIKAELLKGTPDPVSGNKPGDMGITKEQFQKMSLAEKQDLYTKDPESYMKIIEQ